MAADPQTAYFGVIWKKTIEVDPSNVEHMTRFRFSGGGRHYWLAFAFSVPLVVKTKVDIDRVLLQNVGDTNNGID